MSIQGTDKTIARPQGQTAWGRFKTWSGANPRLSRLFWFAVGLGVLALLVWAIYPKPATRARFNNGPQPVGVAVATDSPINVMLNALGTVTPLATATVRPQVGGMLTKIYFTEGQMVKAGDLLAQIDPRPYQAALDQAKGQLARDSATLANAKVDLGRFQALKAQNAISDQMLDTQASAVRSSQGVVESDNANVQSAAINLGYTRIVSPIAGRVGLHLVDVGNIVQAGQAGGVVVVTELSPMSVVFTVPEDNITAIMAQIGQGAELTVDVYDRAQSAKITTGKLSTVDNVIDPTTGTVKLRALYDNTDGKLFPSQFVNVRLLVNTLQHQTVIPVSAVQRGADGSYVFVVSPDKTATQRSVTLGVQEGDKVAIASGLKPGDTVVVDGADRLRDGAEVEIPDPKAQKIQAPSGAAGDADRAAKRAAAQAALTKTCSADIAKLCAGQTGRAVTRCLAQNRASLSTECSAAFAKQRSGGRRGGGAGAAP